jgi:hypothetical protein
MRRGSCASKLFTASRTTPGSSKLEPPLYFTGGYESKHHHLEFE